MGFVFTLSSYGLAGAGGVSSSSSSAERNQKSMLPTDGDRIITRFWNVRNIYTLPWSLVYPPSFEADFEVGKSALCHLGGHFKNDAHLLPPRDTPTVPRGHPRPKTLKKSPKMGLWWALHASAKAMKAASHLAATWPHEVSGKACLLGTKFNRIAKINKKEYA